jgi:hypothetical protein
MNLIAMFGEGRTVDVQVLTCTFGPHTRDFGLKYAVLVDNWRAPRPMQVATFFVGRGGNNQRLRGSFKLDLPAGFSTESVFAQVMFLEKAAKRAGINLSYSRRPQVLQSSDVHCSLHGCFASDLPPSFLNELLARQVTPAADTRARLSEGGPNRAKVIQRS